MKVSILHRRTKGNKTEVVIERHDTWSLDHTLAMIILPALLQLKATKQGVPGQIVTVTGGSGELQDSFDFYKESYDDAWEKNIKLWDEILDKIIWSFQQLALEDYDDLYHHGQAKYDFEECDKQCYNPITKKMEKTYKMVDKNPNEHWYDHVGHQLHEERIQEGLELFGKYYRALWD